MDPLAAYASLFAASFLAATVFPFQSELILMGLVASEEFPWWALLVVATVGNTLGSVVNWLLGRFFLRFLERRWFPVSRPAYEKVERWFTRYGVWSLLFAWLPVVGDSLRPEWYENLELVGLGKLGRYAVLVAATLGWNWDWKWD